MLAKAETAEIPDLSSTDIAVKTAPITQQEVRLKTRCFPCFTISIFYAYRRWKRAGGYHRCSTVERREEKKYNE